MRPIWSGHISFGLISIPISIYSAVEASERVSFRLLHRKDHAPIKFKKFCSKEDVEVPNDEIVRGYDVGGKEYSVVEKEELDKIEEEEGGTTGEMEVLQFIEFGELNPLSFDSPYYTAPRKGGERAYAVLREALNDAHKVGIVRFQLRKHPRLGALIAGPTAIAVESLLPYEELRAPTGLSLPSTKPKPGEVKMAEMLIGQMTADGWDPTEHPNTLRSGLKKLLSSRRRFQLEKGGERPAERENVVDLMEALKRSVGEARSRPKRASARKRGAA
ncbi:MAG TPA: Ku protein [Thermoanaerobaculia bacterium]|jgi:DNA end-binding protein Ku|nr:Ku protein [Thermoanaerobaculia bacterium]